MSDIFFIEKRTLAEIERAAKRRKKEEKKKEIENQKYSPQYEIINKKGNF